MATRSGGVICVSVTNDLVTDQRVHKICETLISFGFEVVLIGRVMKDSLELRERNYRCIRMKLLFRRSVLFYAEYNIRLFFLLLKLKPNRVLANDLDTLASNYLYSKFKGSRIYYDSHEYFTEVPELQNRKISRAFWLRLEKAILPTLKKTYTVSGEVAMAYRNKYSIDMKVVRNFPRLKRKINVKGVKKVPDFVLIYQGVLNIDRGLEEIIRAMQFLDDAVLWIVGGGDIEEDLQSLARSLKLEKKVIFLGKVPFEKLPTITAKADLGLSIEKPVGKNYEMALPNKLFDYIHAEVPVLVSHLIEIEKVFEEFEIGAFIDNHDPEHIAKTIERIRNNEELQKEWGDQLKLAKEKFCWENEESVLREIYLD